MLERVRSRSSGLLVSLVGETPRSEDKSMGSADGDGMVWGMGEDAKAGDCAAWVVDSLRRAEGGGVLAGDDFWGEIDLARSV